MFQKENEVPKHRKKSKKENKKSNHKHVFSLHKTEVKFEAMHSHHSVSIPYIWGKLYHTCDICGKEKIDFKIVSKEEWENLEKGIKKT